MVLIDVISPATHNVQYHGYNLCPSAQSPEWIITPDIKAKYDTYFEGIDKDHDGIVSGEEARGLLMASNLQQPVLAHIW